MKNKIFKNEAAFRKKLKKAKKLELPPEVETETSKAIKREIEHIHREDNKTYTRLCNVIFDKSE